MNYKINRNKYITLKLLERAKSKSNDTIIISEEEYNNFRNSFDETLICEPLIKEYYWYAGQDYPSKNSTVVNDMNSPGWRLTGTTLEEDYKFVTTDNNITDNPTRRESWYIALPVETQYHLYDDLDVNSDGDFITDETVEFNDVTYKIYHLEVPSRALGGITIKK